MMKQIYIIRHAQSIANAGHVISGSSDSPLSDLGRTQAALAGKIAKDYFNFDAIIASPLSRAHETARIVSQQIGINETSITTLPWLQERDLGSLEGSPYETLPQYDARYEDIESSPGIEPIDQFYNRAQRVLQHAHDHPAPNVLLVCHNGIGRMLRIVATGKKPLDFYHEPRLENAILYSLL
jgi:probable phosphoglycerate mutase